MTPLFPENDGPITMAQGQLKNCYLIAAIDCVVNYGPEGYQYFKSMFVVRENGVELHFKNNPFRDYLLKKIGEDKFGSKYGYEYDLDSDKDIIFIPEERLKIIDEDKRAVKTNSLAVKIFERIATYYYAGYTVEPSSEFRELSFDDSIVAHNAEHKMKHPGFHSAVFIGNLLGIETIRYESNEINQVIRLKQKDPRTAVYIAINTEGLEVYNGQTGYHALRLGAIHPSKNPDTDGYVFALVDPHNNQAEKNFTLRVLKKQNLLAFVFNVNDPKHTLIEKVLSEPALEYEEQSEQPKKDLLEELEKDIKQAVREKSVTASLNERKSVLRGLAYYHLTDNVEFITNSGGLRTSFRNGVYNKELVATVVPPIIRLVVAISLMANPKCNWEPYVRNFNVDLPLGLPLDFVAVLIAISDIENPIALFELIFAVSAYNRQLAELIYQQARTNLPNLFQPSMNFYTVSRTIRHSKSSDFKTWFENNSNQSIIEANIVKKQQTLKYLESIHFASFLIVIDSYKRIPSMDNFINLLLLRLETAEECFLYTSDKDGFKKSCSTAMQSSLRFTGLCKTEGNSLIMEKLVDDIKLYAKQFGFSVGTNYNPTMFPQLQPETAQTQLTAGGDYTL